mmetsp:Transcript_10088/g.11794  ORF Transcript_10088/g.11794 Transcript_10088/m.11794 type:complete len:229 (+) Transcript_10088:283-969(+)
MLPLPKFVNPTVFAATSLLVAWTYFNGELFGYHATCMATGFLFFMGQGVVLANQGVVLKAGPQRLKVFQQHMTCQVLGWLNIAGGFYAIYANKTAHNKPHFMTNHSKLGLLVLFLGLIMAPLLGGGGFKWLGIYDKLPLNLQPIVKQSHRWVGGITYALAIPVILLGMATPGIHRDYTTSIMQLLTVACGALIFNSYRLKPTYERASSMPGTYTNLGAQISMESIDAA